MRIAGQRYTDQELIEAIREGGGRRERAMKHLYKAHLEKVCSFIVGRNGSREEAKDVFQDSIVNLLVAIETGKFQSKSSLSTYLYAISKNLWYRRFNRSLKQTSMATDELPEEAADTTPEILLADTHRQQMLGGLMDKLKLKCREVLTLWAQKYAMKEIAQKLGYQNEQVVRNKKNHCLKELKELVRVNPEAQNLVSELVEN